MPSVSPPGSINSAWAPAHPAPPKMVTFRDSLENVGGPGNLFVGRPYRCVNLWEVKTRRGISCLTQGDITGENNNCYASFGECGLDCDLHDTRHLLRLRNEFAVVTAFAEYAFR
jgi:hypothetical protein